MDSGFSQEIMDRPLSATWPKSFPIMFNYESLSEGSLNNSGHCSLIQKILGVYCVPAIVLNARGTKMNKNQHLPSGSLQSKWKADTISSRYNGPFNLQLWEILLISFSIFLTLCVPNIFLLYFDSSFSTSVQKDASYHVKLWRVEHTVTFNYHLAFYYNCYLKVLWPSGRSH